MSKVYLYPQKIFQYLGILAIGLGVTSCATSNGTAATSGETDGVYYSPSKDGQVENYASNSSESYDIKVGSPYFDGNGNGAEEFYYDDQTTETSNQVNVYTGGSNVYVTPGGGTDWGRYEGIDITVNNYGWNDPFWGFGYNSWYWGYPRFGGYYSFHWGWGGYYNSWYNPYWGWGYNHWYSPYWGGYYGYAPHFHYPGYYGNYYAGSPVRSGYRPGSYLAYGGSPYRENIRRGSSLNGMNQGSPRLTRTSSSLNDSGIRPVRQTLGNNTQSGNVRTSEGNIRPTRTENPNVRNNDNTSEVRPVRTTRPDNVRPNTPVRTNENTNIRNNNTRSNSNATQQPTRTNNNVRQNESYSPPRSSSPTIRSGSSSSPSRGSSSMGSGTRSGGSRR